MQNFPGHFTHWPRTLNKWLKISSPTAQCVRLQGRVRYNDVWVASIQKLVFESPKSFTDQRFPDVTKGKKISKSKFPFAFRGVEFSSHLCN